MATAGCCHRLCNKVEGVEDFLKRQQTLKEKVLIWSFLPQKKENILKHTLILSKKTKQNTVYTCCDVCVCCVRVCHPPGDCGLGEITANRLEEDLAGVTASLCTSLLEAA